jgi:hypothetical protein
MAAGGAFWNGISFSDAHVVAALLAAESASFTHFFAGKNRHVGV